MSPQGLSAFGGNDLYPDGRESHDNMPAQSSAREDMRILATRAGVGTTRQAALAASSRKRGIDPSRARGSTPQNSRCLSALPFQT